MLCCRKKALFPVWTSYSVKLLERVFTIAFLFTMRDVLQRRYPRRLCLEGWLTVACIFQVWAHVNDALPSNVYESFKHTDGIQGVSPLVIKAKWMRNGSIRIVGLNMIVFSCECNEE